MGEPCWKKSETLGKDNITKKFKGIRPLDRLHWVDGAMRDTATF